MRTYTLYHIIKCFLYMISQFKSSPAYGKSKAEVWDNTAWKTECWCTAVTRHLMRERMTFQLYFCICCHDETSISHWSHFILNTNRLEQIPPNVFFKSESARFIRTGVSCDEFMFKHSRKGSCPPDSCLSPILGYTCWLLQKTKESSANLVLTVCDSRSFIWANLGVFFL